MSKLEDKLAASIKPTPKPISARKPAPAKPAPAAKASGSKASPAPKASPASRRQRLAEGQGDLNSAHAPLHPGRIWPD